VHPMSCDLTALVVDARDARSLAGFWAALLPWQSTPQPYEGGVEIVPSDDTGFRLRFRDGQGPKTAKNRMHFDLTSASLADQQRTVARALALGGRHVDVGQLPDEPHVVLADPEGNEFCVIEPGNSFLADCGFIGALACDGSREVGYFWSAALGWPLVWDQDQETAIRSPHAGPKITWGGEPAPQQPVPQRLRFQVSARATDRATEVARLVSLGARRLEAGRSPADVVVLADPDGNELFLA
jgi:hypothetical protein